MQRLVFDESLRSGIRDIDKHHARLFKLGHRVLFPPEGKRVSPSKAIRRLVDYTRYHFAAEEFLMEQLGYPRAEAHEKWHQRLAAEVARIERMVQTQGKTRAVRASLHVALDDWLRMHIQGADRQLVEFVKAQRQQHNAVLPTLDVLMRSGLDVSRSVEASVVHAEGIMSQAELRARRSAMAMG